MGNFNAKEVADKAVAWTREWFDKNAPTAKAVIGISGGKDSTITAGILAKAIGVGRIIGVLMPNGVQSDIDDSYRVCDFLGIHPYVVNIKDAVDGIYNQLEREGFILQDLCTINTPPRIRLTTLYAVAGCVNGIVMNNSNASEMYIGYFTKNADNRGDLSLLGNLTVTEVVAVGHALGLPADLVNKVPADGLCGKTDEDRFGFTYKELDEYLACKRDGVDGNVNPSVVEKIEKMHRNSQHKFRNMPTFNPYL